eukprot:1159845-Pelagomonas_calceolata.AAC.3
MGVAQAQKGRQCQVLSCPVLSCPVSKDRGLSLRLLPSAAAAAVCRACRGKSVEWVDEMNYLNS